MNRFHLDGNYLKLGCHTTLPGIALFKPQNQKDCDETIRQIEIMRKNLRTNAKKKQTSL